MSLIFGGKLLEKSNKMILSALFNYLKKREHNYPFLIHPMSKVQKTLT